MGGPLIEWVFSDVAELDPDREDEWMEWYDYHQLLMARLPGWSWVFRYMGLAGPDKYLSLYRLEDYDVLKHIEGWPRVDLGQFEPIREMLHPVALEDWNDKVRRGLSDTGKYTFTGGAGPQNPTDQGHWGWRHLAGAPLNQPFLNMNHCIGTELVSVASSDDAEWIAWYKNHRLPTLVELPGVVDGALFGITKTGHDSEPGYNYITIFELDGEETAASFGDPDRQPPRVAEYHADPEAEPFYALARKLRRNYYRPISKRWSYEM